MIAFGLGLVTYVILLLVFLGLDFETLSFKKKNSLTCLVTI